MRKIYYKFQTLGEVNVIFQMSGVLCVLTRNLMGGLPSVVFSRFEVQVSSLVQLIHEILDLCLHLGFQHREWWLLAMANPPPTHPPSLS